MLSGKKTSLFDFPFFGKFISSSTKLDVAPESINNFIVCRLSTRRVHLFDFVFAIGCTALIVFVSLTFLSSSASWSGAQ